MGSLGKYNGKMSMNMMMSTDEDLEDIGRTGSSSHMQPVDHVTDIYLRHQALTCDHALFLRLPLTTGEGW